MRGKAMAIAAATAVGLASVVAVKGWAKDECKQPLEPVSREVAKLGPGMKPECQDELEVWGIGMCKKKEKAEANALLDARRAACWYALFGGDGMLKTEQEREAFRRFAEEFYAERTIRQFVPWVSDVLERRKLEKKGRKVKLKVRLNVDHCIMKDWLTERNIVSTITNLANIMVLPDVPRGVNPVEALENNKDNRMAKTVIENFFTKEGDFQTAEPKAELTINEVQEATELLEDNAEDYVYRTALMFGADIYFRYEVMVETPVVRGQQMHKAIVRLDAYEATTGLKLGSQTGYSETRPVSVSRQALIEEAVSSGTGDVLTRIRTYWARERELGTQYLLIAVITGDADEDEAMDIQDCFVDCADEVAKRAKFDVITRGRIKSRLWVDSESIPDANRLARGLRNCFKNKCSDWKIVMVSNPGHLISVRIDRAK